MLLVFIAAVFPRFAGLDARVMHGDEAVNAVKFAELWEEGVYRYDPGEFHGPTLAYLTLPAAWLSGAADFAQTDEAFYRVVTAGFGVLLVGLTLAAAPATGWAAALSAGGLVAISPVMTFYSRYYIHEMPLVVFTFGAILAGWGYVRSRSPAGLGGEGMEGRTNRPPPRSRMTQPSLADAPPPPAGGSPRGETAPPSWVWAATCGACIGLMHATKETCVIVWFAMVAALGLGIVWARVWDKRAIEPRRLRRWVRLRDAGIAAGVAAGVSVLFFTSFFTNWRGPLDSVLTYFAWGGAAVGERARHQHPWYWYLSLLIWHEEAPGLWWSEAVVVGLSLVGLIAALVRRGVAPRHVAFARFIGFFALVMTAVYSAIPYKTPWIVLGFYHGMILTAGVGLVAMVRITPIMGRKLAAIGLFAGVAYAVWASRWFRPFPVWRMATLVVSGLGAAAALTIPRRYRAAGTAVLAIALTLALSLHLGGQAYLTNFRFHTDRRNPWVYAHPPRDARRIGERAREIAGVARRGRGMLIRVIDPGGYVWPLPFYLRGFPNVGYYTSIPQRPDAAMIVADPTLRERLGERLEGEYHLGYRGLRPAPFPAHAVYVRRDLWDAFIDTQRRP